MKRKKKKAESIPIIENKLIALEEHSEQLLSPCLEKPGLQQLQSGPLYPYSHKFSVSPPLYK